MNFQFFNPFSKNFLKNFKDPEKARNAELLRNLYGSDEDALHGSYYDPENIPDSRGMMFDEILSTKSDRIQFYRNMYNNSLVRKCINIILQQMVTPNAEGEYARMNITPAYREDISAAEYSCLNREFSHIMKLFRPKMKEYVLKWLIDGELFLENCSDDHGTKIIGVRPLPPAASMVNYSEGFIVGYTQDASLTGSDSHELKRFTVDQISYSNYGLWGVGRNDIRGILEPAIRPLNQLKCMQDALTVKRINLAPERRLWSVYVGRSNDARANQIVNGVMEKYGHVMSIDPETGAIESSKRIQAFTEDIFVPKSDTGNSTTIEPLKGSTEFSGQVDDVKMFEQAVVDALQIPSGRVNREQGSEYSQSPEQSMEEVVFQEMCRTLSKKFADEIVKHTFLVHLMLCGYKEKYLEPDMYDIQIYGSNNFEIVKDLSLWEKKCGILGQVMTMLPSLANSKPDSEEAKPIISKKFLYTNILHMSDVQIKNNEMWLESEMNDLLEKASEEPSTEEEI